MINLPSGIKINDLLNNLRIFCWEASETLLFYSKILKDSNQKGNILINENLNDPVTLADLKVSELIIQRINEKYKNIGWEILSEENVKSCSINCDTTADWVWILDPLDGTKDFLCYAPCTKL